MMSELKQRNRIQINVSPRNTRKELATPSDLEANANSRKVFLKKLFSVFGVFCGKESFCFKAQGVGSLWRVATVLTLVLTAGCAGYHNGTLMNPNYKTIAIAPVKNNTMESLVSTYIRKAAAEQFLVDGSLKVVDVQDADCILYITVNQVETTGVGYDSTDREDNYRPAEWRMRLRGKFTIIAPGHARPLVSERRISGTARYAVTVDQHASRRNGLELLCRDAAEDVVEYTVEGW